MKKIIGFFLVLGFLAAGGPASASEVKTYTSADQKFRYVVLTRQNDVIWGFDFLDANHILFTERGGRVKILNLKNKSVATVTGVPKVWAKGQGGLLDVRRHPTDPARIYLVYSRPVREDKTRTTVLATATLKSHQLQNLREIFVAEPASDQSIQFGARIEFDGEGTDAKHLFVTIGDMNIRGNVQKLSAHNGKTIRLNLDGSVPKDNPFVGKKEARPEIWTYGHRSPEGLVRDPRSGELWLAEMGPRGGDELNLLKAGGNYGWPEVTYGREYWGPRIGVKKKAGTVQPVAYWVPSISPAGIAFYTGDKFPAWKNNLFMGCLSGQHLRRLVLEGNKVVKQEELLQDLHLRFRHVRTGPDGNLYISTDMGHISRLEPVAPPTTSP